MRYTCTKHLFLVYLKFKVHWMSCILHGNLRCQERRYSPRKHEKCLYSTGSHPKIRLSGKYLIVVSILVLEEGMGFALGVSLIFAINKNERTFLEWIGVQCLNEMLPHELGDWD